MAKLGSKQNLAGPASSVNLEVENLENAANVVCTEADSVIWRDKVKAPVLRAAGNLAFSALALTDGSLIVRLHVNDTSCNDTWPELGRPLCAEDLSKSIVAVLPWDTYLKGFPSWGKDSRCCWLSESMTTVND